MKSTILFRIIGITLILMMGAGSAMGAMVVDLFNSAAKESASTAFTFSNLSATTPDFNGGVYDSSAALAENSLSGASGTVSVVWAATTAVDASTWNFDTNSVYEIKDWANGWGLFNTTDVDDSGNFDEGKVFLLTFNCTNLYADPGLSLGFSIRTKDSGDQFTVYERSAAASGSSVWVENTVADQFSPMIKIDGNYEFAIVQTAGANRLNGFSIDIIDPAPEKAAWENVPTAMTASAIRMTAKTGTKPNVEYLFEGEEAAPEAGEPDIVSSGWQTGTEFIAYHLKPDTAYNFRVRMRVIADGLEGSWSDTELVSTLVDAGRPNIVFFYADDLGYSDVSYNKEVRDMGKPYFGHTPHIDTLFEKGIFLSNSMTHQVCSPSRAGLLTGRHYTEVGSGFLVGGYLDDTVPNMARDFQSNGYATAAFGKWHNGQSPTDNVPGLPVNAYGFNSWEGFYGGGQDYFIQADDDNNWWTDGYEHTTDLPGYATDLARDSALEFIDNNADSSFMLYMPFQAVHTPYQILNTDLEAMCNVFDDENPELAWSKVKELTGIGVDGEPGRKVGDVLEMRCSNNDEFDRRHLDNQCEGLSELIYSTMIYAIDRAVGDVLAKLNEEGIADNTILVFSSDNGATRSGNNSIYRGHKLTSWEAGVRVPSAIWYPGTLESTTLPVGNKYTNMVQYIDWYPTLMAAAGLTVNTNAQLDGVNFFDALISGSPVREFWNADTFYYGLDYEWAVVKNDRYKLHYNLVPGAGEMLELYDLWNDPAESVVANGSFPGPLNFMKASLDAWFETGQITTGFMPLPETVNRYPIAQPLGEVLEVAVNQRVNLTNPEEEAIYLRFGMPEWTKERDQHVYPGDMLEYDIYVAPDSDHVSGFFVSPSYYAPTQGETPRFNSVHGMGLNDGLLVNQVFEKGTWTRCVAGIGDVAPGRSLDMTIGLLNSSAGNYHFYIDNVVIRKADGSVRAIVWQDSGDTRGGTLWVHFDGRYYGSYETLPAEAKANYPSAVVSIAQADASLADRDQDGDMMWDDWEEEHFDSAAAIDGHSDYDSDGVFDFFEFLHGTDPKDPASLINPLQIAEAKTGAGGDIVSLSWPARKDITLGASYNIFHSRDLNTWQVLRNHEYTIRAIEEVQADMNQLTIKTTLNSENNYFFRVGK